MFNDVNMTYSSITSDLALSQGLPNDTGASIAEWLSSWLIESKHDWMNNKIKKWTDEWTNERVHEWWTNQETKERRNERTNERRNERAFTNEWNWLTDINFSDPSVTGWWYTYPSEKT